MAEREANLHLHPPLVAEVGAEVVAEVMAVIMKRKMMLTMTQTKDLKIVNIDRMYLLLMAMVVDIINHDSLRLIIICTQVQAFSQTPRIMPRKHI